MTFLLDEHKMSIWALQYCLNVKDDSEIRQLITNSEGAYIYCCIIKDRPEIRKHITDFIDAYQYCKNISKNDERLLQLARNGGYDI